MGKARGFGRRYWLQVLWADDSETWSPHTGDWDSCALRAAMLLASEEVSVVLVLDGRVKEGAIPGVKQIYGEFRRDRVPGAKRFVVMGRSQHEPRVH